jgi:hypothetical protein
MYVLLLWSITLASGSSGVNAAVVRPRERRRGWAARLPA